MKNFMEMAIKEAEIALKNEEVPIGAVIVKDGKVIAKGHNKREKKKNALMHAEIIAINKACKKLQDWRLENCEMYVTLEPCPMCAGAIVNARISKVIYGAKDKTAQDGLFEKILTSVRLNHKTDYVQDTENEEICSKLITNFFKEKRNKKDKNLP